jgi:hypothetical protein
MMVMEPALPDGHAELVPASIPHPERSQPSESWTLKQVQGDGETNMAALVQGRCSRLA